MFRRITYKKSFFLFLKSNEIWSFKQTGLPLQKLGPDLVLYSYNLKINSRTSRKLFQFEWR